MKIYGVYFISCFKHYFQIVQEQMNVLISSGLYDKTDKLYCFISFYDAEKNIELKEFLSHFDKLELIISTENRYEKFAIRNYKKYVPNNENYHLYYFHTKGVSRRVNSEYAERRKILNFYILEKHEICLGLLKDFDCVGCSLLKYPKMHFSGNFWWARSEYLHSLNDGISDLYLAPEMYICSGKTCKPVCLSFKTNKAILKDHIGRTSQDILDHISSQPENNTWGIGMRC